MEATRTTPFQIVVYGKSGCQKCAVLNQRIDKLLEKDEWSDFRKIYIDVLSEDGLIEFCNAECINPQRIPAFIIRQFDEETGNYEYVLNPNPGTHDPVTGTFALYTYLGIQTDYATTGTITPKMIQQILTTARRVCA